MSSKDITLSLLKENNVMLKADGSNWLSWSENFLRIVSSDDRNCDSILSTDPAAIITSDRRAQILQEENKNGSVSDTKKNQLRVYNLNSRLHSLILATLPSSMHAQFTTIHSAREVWDQIRLQCAPHLNMTIRTLCKQLRDTKITTATGIFDYINTVRSVRTQLSKITGQAPNDYISFSDMEEAISGVPSLTPLYMTTKNNMAAADRDDFNKVCEAFLKAIATAGLIAPAAPAPAAVNQIDGPRKCYICGSPNHFKYECPHKDKSNWRDRSPRRSSSRYSQYQQNEHGRSSEREPSQRSRTPNEHSSRSKSPAPRDQSSNQSRPRSRSRSHSPNRHNRSRFPHDRREQPRPATPFHHESHMVQINSLKFADNPHVQLIDSGSSVHINNSKDHADFSTFEPLELKAICSNGSPLEILGEGLIYYQTNSKHIISIRAYWAPNSKVNILSSGALLADGFRSRANQKQELFFRGKECIHFTRRDNGLAYANLRPVIKNAEAVESDQPDPQEAEQYHVTFTTDTPCREVRNKPVDFYFSAHARPDYKSSINSSSAEAEKKPVKGILRHKPHKTHHTPSIFNSEFTAKRSAPPSSTSDPKRPATIRVGELDKQLRSLIAHVTYGHLSHKYLPGHAKLDKVTWCDACRKSKTVRPSFKNSNSNSRSSRKGQTYHSDLAGPFTPSAVPDRSRYFSALREDLTGFINVDLHRDKTSVDEEILYHLRNDANLFGHNPECIYLDRGGETASNDFKNALHQLGTRIHLAPTQLHERNAVAEGTINALQRIARSLIIQAGLPRCMWEVTMTSTYISPLGIQSLL
jgi:hypothetical protein